MTTLLFLIVTLRYRCLPSERWTVHCKWGKHAAFDGVSWAEPLLVGGQASVLSMVLASSLRFQTWACSLPWKRIAQQSQCLPWVGTSFCPRLPISRKPNWLWVRAIYLDTEESPLQAEGTSAADDKLTSWILLVIVVCINETHGLISISLCVQKSRSQFPFHSGSHCGEVMAL